MLSQCVCLSRALAAHCSKTISVRIRHFDSESFPVTWCRLRKIPDRDLGQRTWQFIGGHCCWCPNDAKWCSVVCVERGSVLRKALVTKAAYWWSVIRPGCQVPRERVGHILMDNWRPVLWNPPLLWFSQFGPVSKVVRTCCCCQGM